MVNGKWIQSGVLAFRSLSFKLDLQQFSMVQNEGMGAIRELLCIEEKKSSIKEADLALLSSEEEEEVNEESSNESPKEELLQSEEEETSGSELESEKIEVVLIDLAHWIVGASTRRNEGQY